VGQDPDLPRKAEQDPDLLRKAEQVKASGGGSPSQDSVRPAWDEGSCLGGRSGRLAQRRLAKGGARLGDEPLVRLPDKVVLSRDEVATVIFALDSAEEEPAIEPSTRRRIAAADPAHVQALDRTRRPAGRRSGGVA